jgi:hypothetical protein
MTYEGAKRTRSPRIDPDVIGEIHRLAETELTPTEIQRTMDLDDKFKGRVPDTLKTIRKYANQVRPPDPSERWSLASDETGRPRAVLDALAAAIGATDGRVTSISLAEAEKIAQIAAVADGLPAVSLWRLARLYVAREWRTEDTHDIDVYLAFCPWKPDGEAQYQAAARMGHITPPPFFVQTPAQVIEAAIKAAKKTVVREGEADPPLTEERPR